MKRILIIVLSFAISFTAFAQEELINSKEALQFADEFIRENIDEKVLEALGVDTERTRKFLTDLEQKFQGTYVYDVGELRETAKQILPLLQQFEETQPYAVWLQSRLDYFEVAEKLQKLVSRVPTNTARLPAPTPKIQRKAWIEVVEERPMPSLAYKQVSGLKRIFALEKVPTELVWLAEVESSFNSSAKSPAGAAGLFQLMPKTARSLDLSVGLLRDERMHPEKNARAAAHYLHQLHQRFGDWRLALAAYNAGPSAVSTLLKKHKARTFDEIAHRLPAETQLYVPKVEATIRKREGRALADLRLAQAVRK